MHSRRYGLFSLLALGASIACAPEHDIVIRGGTLFGGTGSPGVVGDHVRTQLPYALTAAGVTVVIYVVLGFLLS